MLGDTAVAVHPDDERYSHLVGREIELPLTGRRIPVVADEARRPGVRHGSGQGDARARPERLRDRPAARPRDDRRHGRARPSSPRTARSRGSTGGGAPGGGRGAARAGRIVAEKRPYIHAVGHVRAARRWSSRGSRCSGSYAWSGSPRRRATRCATAACGSCPRSWRSATSSGSTTCATGASRRQLWWGHRIPVWYGADGEIRCVGPASRRPRAGPRTPTCSTRGSPRRCGRSRRWAGRTTRLSSGRTIRLGAGHGVRHPLLLGRADDDVRAVRHGRGRPFRRVACTAWCATSTARRCRSRSATSSTRSNGSSATAPTRCASRSLRGATPGSDSRSARSGSKASATSATSCGTPPASC